MISNQLNKINIKDYDCVISLGLCCETTSVIRELELDKEKKSYPFDWIAIYNINEIPILVDNKFDKFFNVDIKPNKYYDNKMQLSTDFYNIFIPHHTKENFIKKFTVKISNLYNALSSNKKLLFLLKCPADNKCSPSQCSNIINSINKYTSNYTFILINEFDTVKIEEYPKDCFVYQVQQIVQYEKHLDVWKKILN